MPQRTFFDKGAYAESEAKRPQSLGKVREMYTEEDLIMQLSGMASPARMERPTAPGSKWGLVGYPLASVYAPLQEWRDTYNEEMALQHGTLFHELDKPFLGAGG